MILRLDTHMPPHLSTCDRDSAGRESEDDKLLLVLKELFRLGIRPGGTRFHARNHHFIPLKGHILATSNQQTIAVTFYQWI